MNWTVTYRAKDGEKKQDVFEAEGRDALFKQLSDKGISAIRIEEAANGRKPAMPRKKPGCA